ncbi:COX15/CtaA family protein [bacterium]|nr:COX15/CtaA family protein [bacterium]
MESVRTPSHRGLIIWLMTGYVMVLLMVMIGGITRLTGSGLSIVEWNVIMGAVPPMNDHEWDNAFEKYQQFPQYQLINAHMTVEDFKSIFWWEYIHRLWGRLIGFVFVIPFVYFLVKKQLTSGLIKKFLFVFILGGLQGAMGWYMVQSGLVDNPYVSHLRLTVHLLLALAICTVLWWQSLELMAAGTTRRSHVLVRWTLLFMLLTVVQIIFGGMTAGLKAGHVYNTFPKMGDEWIASGVWQMSPWWMNFFENPFMVQFLHRSAGILVTILTLVFWWKAGRLSLEDRIRWRILAVIAAVAIQFSLGVWTLLERVPVILGVLHQLGAFILFSILVWLYHGLKTEKI